MTVMCLPALPLQMHGCIHQALETQKRMTRRSPFQEGEGGVPQGNPHCLQSWSIWLEVGFPLDHHHMHCIWHSLSQMWVG